MDILLKRVLKCFCGLEKYNIKGEVLCLGFRLIVFEFEKG